MQVGLWTLLKSETTVSPRWFRYYTRLRLGRLASIRSSSTMPRLDVSPQVALVDEKISITASGLRPVQKVTLRVWLNEQRAVYCSCAQFVADHQGCVATALQSSQGGTYSGTDSMGLFWSMKPVPGVSEKTRLMKRDITSPFVFKLSLVDGHVEFDDLKDLSSLTVLATTTCERLYKHRDVRRIPVREGALRGMLFLPAGSGPFPGVIDIYGSAGGLIEIRAALLASRGFATFALAYFDYDDLPSSLLYLDVNYFLEAVDWFSSQSFVHQHGVGIVGVSKGGELGFVLAACCDKVKAVVNISGAPALSFDDLNKNGEVYIKGLNYDVGLAKHTDEGYTFHDCFPFVSKSFFPVWKKNAKILYLCGGDDGTWDTLHLTAEFEKAFPSDRKNNIERVVYAGAGHLLEPPYMPLCRASWHKHLGIIVVWGGQPRSHAAAQEDAWRRILSFLHKHLDHRPTVISHL